MTLILLSTISMAHASESIDFPEWPISNGWSALLGAVAIGLALNSRKWPNSLQKAMGSMGVALTLLGGGWLLGDPIRSWLLLALVIGFGWSLRTQVADVFASGLLRMGRKTKSHITVNGFSGEITAINWRSITIVQETGLPLNIPSRLVFKTVVSYLPPGQCPTMIRIPLPETISFQDAINRIEQRLPAIPWLLKTNASYDFDENNPNVLSVQLNLMRICDKEKVRKSIANALLTEATGL